MEGDMEKYRWQCGQAFSDWIFNDAKAALEGGKKWARLCDKSLDVESVIVWRKLVEQIPTEWVDKQPPVR